MPQTVSLESHLDISEYAVQSSYLAPNILHEGWFRFKPVTSCHTSDTMSRNQLNQNSKAYADG